jgi:hypothetical protein
MDNQETLTTLGNHTHHTERRQTKKRQKQPTKMDNQETLTTLDTHHTERRQTNKRQKKNPQKWTIQRH